MKTRRYAVSNGTAQLSEALSSSRLCYFGHMLPGSLNTDDISSAGYEASTWLPFCGHQVDGPLSDMTPLSNVCQEFVGGDSVTELFATLSSNEHGRLAAGGGRRCGYVDRLSIQERRRKAAAGETGTGACVGRHSILRRQEGSMAGEANTFIRIAVRCV